MLNRNTTPNIYFNRRLSMTNVFKITKSNFDKRINPHKRVRSNWVRHVNDQKKLEPIIYDCGVFAIERLYTKSKIATQHEENLKILQEFEDLYNN